MARTIECTGTIETVCTPTPIRVGDTISILFRPDDEVDPPFNLRIRSPNGNPIVERVLRELPTDLPQSAPPITFTASVAGEYRIEIWQLYGKQRGDAIMRVSL